MPHSFGAVAGATADPLLDISGLRFSYRDRSVLTAVDLRIDSGEIFALLGPNGAGKTTLIKLICGRYRPAAGTLLLLGEPPAQSRRALGLAPQDIALYPHLTARENLRVFARLAGVARGEVAAAAERALRITGLEDRADALIAQLSGGYQRRVNIAAAIVHRPRLLILDEPTVGIDLDARRAIGRLLAELADAGTGVLLVSHDLEQAERLADRIGFLLDGRLAPQGRADELIAATFGNERQLEVTLRDVPDERQRTYLHEAALVPAADPRIWSGPALSIAIESVQIQLESAGIAVQAVCVRRPDLRSLFQRLTSGAAS